LAELKQLKSSTATLTNIDVSDEGLAAIIRRQIAIYDADKTNMPDYALENSGLYNEEILLQLHNQFIL
jgi:hypothetical protein